MQGFALPVMPPPPASSPPSPLGRRLYLLCILLLLPMAAVSLPTLVITHFFGQRPASKQPTKAEEANSAAAFATLRGSLEKAAREGLPDDAGLNFGAKFDALTLACPPEVADARLDTLRAFAAQCQGTVLDQPADATGRHLLVELPETNAARFRQLAATGTSNPELTPPAAGITADAKVFLNVTLAPAPADATAANVAVKPGP